MSISKNELEAYAHLIVHGGVHLRSGQRLFISGAPVEAPEVVEAVAEQAYRAGASLVDPLWSSDRLLQIRLRNAPDDTFGEYPDWRSKGLLEGAKRGDAFLIFLSSDPDLLRDENPAHVAELVKASSRSNAAFLDMRMSFLIQWTVAAVPTLGWAKRVFPEMEAGAALDRLWEDLLGFCRVDGRHTLDSWRAHVEDIETRKHVMESKQYRALRFEGEGTDIEVGLPENQRWNGGRISTPAGTSYSPNIPTEEVFTMPHRERVEGTVRATRPVHYSGLVIENLTLRFERGAVVEASAETGQEQIDRILGTDAGAVRLGEVALVSDDGPIARAGRAYLNGLIDENATSHLAIGQAYRDCVEGGRSMNGEQFEAAGGNTSAIHIDFMVGSPELDVYGITCEGGVEAVLKRGVWAF